ncbi:Centrosomal protein of 57 kDa [Heterocephalus glaber]|uniref:Centrosomal protein of 57 kDa n=1 Tax=Heterocephalus glaber TaxID=10181 RepID=G5BC09_HETGA|nr:Centrosomal protein of 57 kDa [Heterocephalus glaber]
MYPKSSLSLNCGVAILGFSFPYSVVLCSKDHENPELFPSAWDTFFGVRLIQTQAECSRERAPKTQPGPQDPALPNVFSSRSIQTCHWWKLTKEVHSTRLISQSSLGHGDDDCGHMSWWTWCAWEEALAEKYRGAGQRGQKWHQHQRLTFEDKTTSYAPPLQEKLKKKKSKPPEKKGPRNYFDAQPHYRLCLRDMPFVAKKSTSPSHAVVANVQHVLHLMKQHSKVLCNDRVVNDISLAKQVPSQGSRSKKSATPPSSSSIKEELSEVLQSLQDEFGQMNFDHQQLAKLIQESPNTELKDSFECELEALVGKMEAEANQITEVRKYQAQLEKQKKEVRANKKTLDEEGNSSSHSSGIMGTISKKDFPK